LASLLVERDHALLHQSYAPRHQRHGRMNADGFGVGWYAPDERATPARYRRAVPMWGDRTFASIAGVIRTGALLAAVRNASPGLPTDESCTAPYTTEQWLFSHNGRVVDWHGPDGAGLKLRRRVSDRRAAAIEGATDSEVLFALVLDAMDGGADAPDALAAVVEVVHAHDPAARLNLLLTDGTTIAATACGDSLFTLAGDGAVVVASEPYDDDPKWQSVPEHCLVVATVSDLILEALA
jgi:glutamine amidotransferase